MELWTMTLDGRRVRMVLAHRAHVAAMTEGEPFTAEQTERLTAALTQMDAMAGYAVHYVSDRGTFPSAGRSCWRALERRARGRNRLRRLLEAGIYAKVRESKKTG